MALQAQEKCALFLIKVKVLIKSSLPEADLQYETRLFVRLMLSQSSLNAEGRTKSFYSSTEGQANAH